MRLAAAFGLAALILFAQPAFAQGFDTPEALIEDLYNYAMLDHEWAEDEVSGYDAYLSTDLLDLYRTDVENTAPGDAPSIDFDPVASGQDNLISEVTIGTPIILDDTAEIEVEFLNYDAAVTLYYTLVLEPDGWKVDDIADQRADFPWSLREILETANP